MCVGSLVFSVPHAHFFLCQLMTAEGRGTMDGIESSGFKLMYGTACVEEGCESR